MIWPFSALFLNSLSSSCPPLLCTSVRGGGISFDSLSSYVGGTRGTAFILVLCENSFDRQVFYSNRGNHSVQTCFCVAIKNKNCSSKFFQFFFCKMKPVTCNLHANGYNSSWIYPKWSDHLDGIILDLDDEIALPFNLYR